MVMSVHPESNERSNAQVEHEKPLQNHPMVVVQHVGGGVRRDLNSKLKSSSQATTSIVEDLAPPPRGLTSLTKAPKLVSTVLSWPLIMTCCLPGGRHVAMEAVSTKSQKLIFATRMEFTGVGKLHALWPDLRLVGSPVRRP